MSTPETDEKFFDTDCCACDERVGNRGENINMVQLQKKAEWEYPAMGNVLFDIPAEYAMAVVCDVCVKEENDPEYALKGEDLERVPIDELQDLPPMQERIEDQP